MLRIQEIVGRNPDPARLMGSGSGMVLNGNDPEVIQACQRGEQDAFAVLFATNKDKVYSIALRYSGNEAAAMDIAQETFLKLWSHIKEFRGESSFEGWLYRIVANACLDYQRRRRRLTFVDDLRNVCGSSKSTALHELVREEIKENVQQMVGKLPPEQRMAVVLRYTEELSYEEIAEAMGCSRGTVASRLNRAHKVLERRLWHLRGTQGAGNG
jgi:RNA polymerase sigma-70 factor (ECF subfamily)